MNSNPADMKYNRPFYNSREFKYSNSVIEQRTFAAKINARSIRQFRTAETISRHILSLDLFSQNIRCAGMQLPLKVGAMDFQ